MKTKLISMVLILLSFALTACTTPNNNNSGAEIDWVDFIVLNNINYLGNYQGDNKYEQGSMDGVIGKVTFNVSKNVKDPAYKLKNGDAAFLPVGTEIYKIKGFKPEFRIAVNTEGKWRVYEADTNPIAKKGEDLLDIKDKVSYIDINSETDGTTELGAIKEKVTIDKLVNMVLASEVDQNRKDQVGQRYFISFHLLDGTNVTRSYWIDSGELSRGIMLPDEFGIEIKKTLLRGGKILSEDLNGDGKKETISAAFTGNVCILKINNESLRIQGSSFQEELYIVDINKKDIIKEIAFSEEGSSSDFRTYFYTFDGKIKKVGEIQGYYQAENPKEIGAIRIDGDNIVNGISRGTYFQTWFFHDIYDLTKSHVLKHRDQKLYKAVWTNELIAKRAVKCLTDDKHTVRVILQKGEKVQFIGSDEKGYCLIKLSSGKNYWIKGTVDANALFGGISNAD